jgi:uncharacterized membrane protein YeiH
MLVFFLRIYYFIFIMYVIPYEERILFILEVLGLAAFAASGALAALKSRMDFFGALVLAGVTAVGGGVMRDIILKVPVILFIENTHYVFICVITTLIVLFFQRYIERFNRFILLFDSIGLALFTAMGTLRALNAGAPWSGALLLATLTACGGGMLRDILRNERPYVLYGDFYAMASVLGSSVLLFIMFVLKGSERVASLACVLTVFVIRVIVLSYQLRKVRHTGAAYEPDTAGHLKPEDEDEAIQEAIDKLDNDT